MLSSGAANCARTPCSIDNGSSEFETRCRPDYNSDSPVTGRTISSEAMDLQPTSPTVKALGSLNSPVSSLAFDLISNLAVELSPDLKTPRRCLLGTLAAAKSAISPEAFPSMEVDSPPTSFLSGNEGETNATMILTVSDEAEDGYEPMEDVKNDDDASPLGRLNAAPCLRQTTLAFGPVVPSLKLNLDKKNASDPCNNNSRLKRLSTATLKPPLHSAGFNSRNPFTKEITSHWSQRRNNVPPFLKDNYAISKLQTQSVFGGLQHGTPTPSDIRARVCSEDDDTDFLNQTPTILRTSSLAQQDTAMDGEKEDGSNNNANSPIFDASPCIAPPPKFRRTQSASSGLFNNASRSKQLHGVRHCNSVPDPLTPTLADSTILPCIETGRDAIKRISSTTLIELINGRYQHQYDQHFVIDCRFPYEFEGGHIKSALNINTMDALENMLLRNPIAGKKVVLIFHCEFSSQRAPRMALHLRSQDRRLNVHNYPNLNYPEVYILKGGYKEFFAEYKEHCLPQRYVEMVDEAYKEECKSSMTLYKRSFKRAKSYTEGYGSTASSGTTSCHLTSTTKTNSAMFFSSTSSSWSSARTATSAEASDLSSGPFTRSSITGNRSSNFRFTACSNPTSRSSGLQASYLSSLSSLEATILECPQDTLE